MHTVYYSYMVIILLGSYVASCAFINNNLCKGTGACMDRPRACWGEATKQWIPIKQRAASPRSYRILGCHYNYCVVPFL